MTRFDGPKWDDLLKWSLSYADGTFSPSRLSEEDRWWFMEAMQAQTVYVVKRMKEITIIMQMPREILEEQGVTIADLEGVLEELQEHVEFIGIANYLHTIGGLIPLLGYLKHPHALIRAKVVKARINVVQQMSSDDLGPAKEERWLVDSLWKMCYNEPSSLQVNGLLVLLGEDAPPPNVASKHFEPPLRAWAASRNDATCSRTNQEANHVFLLAAGPTTPSGNFESNSKDSTCSSSGHKVLRDINSNSS
ncbi:hypothetical protein KI387_017014 [Taxus chinensis]|uniref:Nucleotide exchange factor Fes1 domain-containing protein n=1 Tax=Taxus chinensis TaxID=29808 RepID=A0AA38GI72_TAXCH|nr:hypothetical protein KI387_017014 [Taxus chinensis]